MFTQNFFPASSAAIKKATIPAREDIPLEEQWHIQDIYASQADWERARDSLPAKCSQLAAFQGRLSDPAELLACLTLSEEIDLLLLKVYCYAHLQQDSDTGNTTYQEMFGSVLPLSDQASMAAAFIVPELLTLPEETLSAMPHALPGLKPYDFFIRKLLRQKKHVLPADKETLLAATGSICQSASLAYTTMVNADLQFPDIPQADGSALPLSESRYSKYITSKNRHLRQESFHHLFTTYLGFRNTFTSLYTSSIKASKFMADTHNYPSMIAAALEPENIPLAVYDTTIETTRAHLPLLHRYTALKQRLLEVDELHMYDLYVPIVQDLQRTFPYAEGCQLIKQALHPLGTAYLTDMQQGIDSGWIDYHENRGKRNGAYSRGIYGIHPFVLTSYDEQYNAVTTLAHELGHAMHSFYSDRKQPFVTSNYSLFCAEVASTTNENLLLEYMLEHASSKEEKLYFLNQYLEQIRATVYRQTFFAEFEKTTHAMIEKQVPLTADVLEELWMKLNRAYYGPDIIIDDELRAEWSRIPHFYMPFYVYQYATGYAAAVTLSHKLRTQGEAARKDYLAYLASGGSDDPIALLQKAGVDMTCDAPLKITFQKFASCLDELEAITK